jgi:hypothetical protein
LKKHFAAGGKVTRYEDNERFYYNKEDLLNGWFWLNEARGRFSCFFFGRTRTVPPLSALRKSGLKPIYKASF